MSLPDNYYLTTIENRRTYAPLSADVTADVCVIGAGLAGINTAYSLMQRGLSVAVLESHHVGYGASGRLAGFVAKGYGLGEGALLKKIGHDKALALVELTKAARKTIRDRAATHNLAAGSFVDGVMTVSLKDDPQAVKSYIELQNAHFDLGFEFWGREQVREHCRTEKYFDAVYSPRDFQMNPVQYLHGLADVVARSGNSIFENSGVNKIERDGAGWRVHTAGGSVRAKDIVVCTALYSHGLDSRLERSMIPVQTYITVTEPIDDSIYAQSINTRHAIYDTRFCSDYYRRLPDGRLLWGGRVGLFAHPGNIAEAMVHDMLKIYPQLEGKIKPAFAWAGILAYAAHKMPQIGKFDDGYWYNTGYGGHGLCPTTVGGEAVAAAIAGKTGDIEKFAPFGVHFSGGRTGRFAAQGVYLWWKLRDWWALR